MGIRCLRDVSARGNLPSTGDGLPIEYPGIEDFSRNFRSNLHDVLIHLHPPCGRAPLPGNEKGHQKHKDPDQRRDLPPEIEPDDPELN